MINSLRARILIWFIFFSVLLLSSITILNSRYYKKREEKNKLITSFAYMQNDMLKVINNSSAFFRNEITNEDFFETSSTKYLEIHDTKTKNIYSELNKLKSLSLQEQINISSEADTILNAITEFNLIFHQVVDLILERGYKDYGVEGEMRDYIHQLEHISNVDKTNVLMLRRHEKDYIIRNEKQYITKLNKLAEEFKIQVVNNSGLTQTEKNDQIAIVDHYKLLFNKMVDLDSRIGLRDNSALKGELDILSHYIEKHIDNLNLKLQEENHVLLLKARYNYILLFIVAIILSIGFSLLITKRVTASLVLLTEYISNVTKSDFLQREDIGRIKADAEIKMIFNEFNRMAEHLDNRERQRDKALVQVKQQEIHYRQMADMLPLELFELNLDGNFEYVNKRWEKTFKYHPSVIKDIHVSDILPEKDLFKHIKNKVSIGSYETKAITSDGNSFPVLLYSSQILDNNVVKGLRFVLVDITERMKAIEALKAAKAKAEESDKLKSAFLANMSHEIRTPMNSIIGFADLLLAFAKTEEDRKKYICQIQNSGKLLLNIIDDIIDISKIEAGKINIRKDNFDINSIMCELHQHFLNTIQNVKSDVKLILENEIDGKLIIKGDPDKLKQILINLISNAIKFTHEGYIHIGYEINEGYLRFIVKDTGIGIPEDKQKLIFQRFRQADETLNRKYGGTGLGLAISQNLVNLMGGEIDVESTPGKGSTFTFTLPYDDIELRSATVPENRSITIKEYNWENRTVLITEDDEASYRYLFEFLKLTGINILHAENGKEAIELFSEHLEIDVVLMDIHMPILNGYDATRAIKQINKNIPVIAQTAYAMADERKLCIDAGCNDFISKPVKRDEILAIMEKYLGVSLREDIKNRIKLQGN